MASGPELSRSPQLPALHLREPLLRAEDAPAEGEGKIPTRARLGQGSPTGLILPARARHPVTRSAWQSFTQNAFVTAREKAGPPTISLPIRCGIPARR